MKFSEELSVQMDIRAWEVWQEDLTVPEKADKLNKEFGCNWVPRTWGQRAVRHKSALRAETDANEMLAKREIRIMKEQKKTVLMKKELHKETLFASKKELLEETFIEKFKEIEINRIKPTDKKHVWESKVLVLGKADDQFTGSNEDIDIQRNFYHNAYQLGLEQGKEKIVILFGGDSIEGWLHQSTLTYAPKTPEEQMAMFIEETIAGIDLLASKFQVEILYLTSSNHTQSRSLNTQRNAHLKNDLELLAATSLHYAFRDVENVKLNFGGIFKDRTIDGFEGKKIALTHSALGFEKNAKSLAAQYHNSDIIIKAHTHTLAIEEVMGKQIITIPPLKKFVTDYEVNLGFMDVPEDLDSKKLRWTSRFLELGYQHGSLKVIVHENKFNL